MTLLTVHQDNHPTPATTATGTGTGTATGPHPAAEPDPTTRTSTETKTGTGTSAKTPVDPTRMPRLTTTVPREYVHRSTLAEVFLTGCEQTGNTHYTLTAQWPRAHTFFTTPDGTHHHPLQAAETIRQTGIYLAHAELGIPLGHHFLMRNLHLTTHPQHLTIGPTPTDLTPHRHLHPHHPHTKRPTDFTMHITITRNGHPTATGTGRFTCLTPTTYQRLRHPPTPPHQTPPTAATTTSTSTVRTQHQPPPPTHPLRTHPPPTTSSSPPPQTPTPGNSPPTPTTPYSFGPHHLTTSPAWSPRSRPPSRHRPHPPPTPTPTTHPTHPTTLHATFHHYTEHHTPTYITTHTTTNDNNQTPTTHITAHQNNTTVFTAQLTTHTPTHT
ncbi:hypothetical protein FNV64_05435 [Streptomyces sp. S1A1-7]|uniref:AfsA-related hotdog domain-containing protein n=1 Tax=Streptomyces sp. S1A1-7 TaxID=2594459 RepID=UPI001163765A|nr:AfsA-related hotdog domain-containing protein [Streptomyces sp. S1A1-7]QDN75128.1 hypothetical protein FNV64_05435 [Streptomyces sp. S1A1-7]